MVDKKLPIGLITDTKSLMKAITSVHNMGKKYHEQLHIVACSTMHHVAAYGQIEPLRRFLEGLEVAYQSAFRQWVGKLAGPSVGQDQWIEWGVPEKAPKGSKPTFIVKEGTKELRAKWAEEKIQPVFEGKKFFERDPRQGVNEFGDEQIVKALEGLLKRIERVEAEMREKGEDAKLPFNPQLVGVIREATKKAETIAPRETKH